LFANNPIFDGVSAKVQSENDGEKLSGIKFEKDGEKRQVGTIWNVIMFK
jgi:hypothetical protein